MTDVEPSPILSHSSGSVSDSDLSDFPPPTPPNLHQNSADPSVSWLVQKYGGTSVGKFAETIAEEIVPCVSFLLDVMGVYGEQYTCRVLQF